jgi:succinyl-CoA synthetase alpha subunit
MLDMGSQVLAGVTPGKAGETVAGVPVFDTVFQAKDAFPNLDATFICTPPSSARSSCFEAIAAGFKLIVLHTERVPLHDVLDVVSYAKELRARVIGPNTIGVLSPGRCLVGSQGATVEYSRKIFLQGPCGVISRSGGQTTTLCYFLARNGIGASTVVSTGGDAVVGTSIAELLELFEKDQETKIVVAFGEIGTSAEEDAAAVIAERKFTKPFIIYVAGRFAMPEMRFGHAGAIITRGQGTADRKREVLKAAGAVVLESLSDVGVVAAGMLRRISNEAPGQKRIYGGLRLWEKRLAKRS